MAKKQESISGNVLIAGASSGIGLRCAAQFLEKGYKVYNISRGGCPLPSVDNCCADCAKPGETAAAVERAAGNGKIAVAVYCPGFSVASPLETISEADYRYLFEVNFFGAAEFVKAVLPHMSGGGRIVLISSLAGILPVPFQSFYNASKAALNAFAMSLNLELHDNIKVIAVMPGGTKTPFTQRRKVYNTEAADENFDNAVEECAVSEQHGDDARVVASEIIKNIFKKEPKVLFVPCLKNKVRAAACAVTPDNMKLDGIRKKYHQQ